MPVSAPTIEVVPRSRAPLWVALLTFAVVSGALTAVLALRDGWGAGLPTTRAAGPVTGEAAGLAAQVVQLRRDEVLGRVEVALRNRGRGPVVVDRLRLRVGGFTGGGWVAKDSPVPAGQLVDLTTPYGEPRCPSSGTPAVGGVALDLRVHRGSTADGQDVLVRPTRSRGLLARVLRSLCTERRLRAEVGLSFGPTWRRTGRGAATRLHTTVEARLAPSAPPRTLTQVRGTVLYDLLARSSRSPLARLDAAHPSASVPVVVSRATCTGHAKGETKQPYRFLVWVGERGSAGKAADLPVSPSQRVRLQAVCAF